MLHWLSPRGGRNLRDAEGLGYAAGAPLERYLDPTNQVAQRKPHHQLELSIQSGISSPAVAVSGRNLQDIAAAVGAQSAPARAARFTAQAEVYQATIAQAVLIHDRFVATLAAGADSFTATKATNVSAAS